jgi:UDP-glucose 4-epimerase
MNVALGKADKVSVFGDDYETEDGTGVRDYIHIMDVAQAHLYGFAYIQQFLDASTSSDTAVVQ